MIGWGSREKGAGVVLWSRRARTPVATAEVAFVGERTAMVSSWVAQAERQEMGYHAVLHFLMYYARLLFFLSYRSTADELVAWTDDAVRSLAEAEEGAPVAVARDWQFTDGQTDEPRAVWSSSLLLVAPMKYTCTSERPPVPEDTDAQGAALLYFQRLVDTLPPFERAYLTLGVSGMHDYYRTIQHWGNSKSLHPAPAHGISRARRVLQGR